MKSALLSLMCLSLFACSNSDSGFLIERNTNVVEERPLVSSTEVAKEELKDSARSMLLGKASEDKVISKFSAFLKLGNGEENLIKDKVSYNNYLSHVESETLSLNNELMLIFNERVDVYLTLLNASLADNNINPVKIKFDANNPKSAQDALNSLYSSLRSRVKTLSLREQYMIFQLTEFFIQKYNSENIEAIVPRDSVAKFVETLISLGKNNPQETFRKYQVVHKFLSEGELLSVFKPIIAKVAIDKNSNFNEVESFRKMAYFSIAQKYTAFAEDSDDVKRFFKSLYFASSLLLKNIPGKDSEAPNLFRSINMSFKSNQVFLAQIASENGMSVHEVAEIQDLFVSEYYFPFIKSLEDKAPRYKQFLESSNVAGPALPLEILLASFQSDIKKIDFDSLMVKYYESLNELKNVHDENIQKYMSQYNIATTGTMILAINGKYNAEATKKHKELYEINERSKEALKSVLNERNVNQAELLSKMINEESEEDSAYLMSGVFKGNLVTSKKLYLHPLAVIIPEGDQLVIEVQSLSGGRIDGNFHVVDSNFVKNQDESVSIYTGNKPSQGGLSSTDVKNKCRDKPKVCMEAGVSGGKMSYSRSVSAGSIPAKEKSGVSGIDGKSIQIKLASSITLDSLIISNGLKGFKGRKGINSPLCNSVNEYQPFMGVAYSFTCEYSNRPSDCDGTLNANEGSLSAYHVNAGLSGDGGSGGRGGNISITLSDEKSSKYPALSLGGFGGIPGDRAVCISVTQVSGFLGNEGQTGENGKISLIK